MNHHSKRVTKHVHASVSTTFTRRLFNTAGYRSHYGVMEALHSMFTLHTETVRAPTAATEKSPQFSS